LDYQRLTTAELNQLWGAAIVDALAKSNCLHFVISPGSRSTPIVLAAGRDPRLKCKIIHDERAAAYYAVGIAKVLHRPVVLVCTSGTAVANFYPAVVEASVDNIPLIILSADRPPELRETGANQTINQTRIYDHYPRWFFDFPAPTEDINLNFVYSTISHAVFSATKSPSGPVHINCMFREPFIPQQHVEQHLNDWQPTNYVCTPPGIPGKVVDQFQSTIQKSRQPLIVAGRGLLPGQLKSIISFAEKFQIPVFADITNGLRMFRQSDVVVHYFDQLLLSDKFKSMLQPDFVLYFGAIAVSKRLLLWLDELNIKQHWHIGLWYHRQNPLHKVTAAIYADIAAFCDSMVNLAKNEPPGGQCVWTLKRLDDIVDKEINAAISEWDETISEISIARLLSMNIQQNFSLFLSSSMPIRNMDMYAAVTNKLIQVNCNRGASGIDGIISTACGVAAGNGQGVVTMIGDIALLHDLNSLLLLRDATQTHIVVVVNNDGGGIFSFLPVASQNDVFEKYFATPHGLSFQYAAKLFDLAYAAPQTNTDFVATLQKWQVNSIKGIIEIKTKRSTNVEQHLQIQKRLKIVIDEKL
jgi:2-succinyl-5-enolpyruvyl-6-hydroxy-3-cyclohexene-1-carboxylate synthase